MKSMHEKTKQILALFEDLIAQKGEGAVLYN